MRKTTFLWIITLSIIGCKPSKHAVKVNRSNESIVDFSIAFGSCNKHDVENTLWDDVINSNPDLWIWGGDIVYADTDNMRLLKSIYDKQNLVPDYARLKIQTPIIGTWDDHDYGLNDGGTGFSAKNGSQAEFLDFIGVGKTDKRRNQKGIYSSHEYKTNQGSIKVIVLDTRFFRTPLTKDNQSKKRFKPNNYGEGTILGNEQWTWFENELNNSKSDFNIIVSSIQVLSGLHGFETWGNMPHEVDKLEKVVDLSGAKGVVILSGDRHFSEFSIKKIENLSYPLIDFTSSGLTHAYHSFTSEENPFRVGKVVNIESFGLLQFNFQKKIITFKIVGDNGKTLQEIEQAYP